MGDLILPSKLSNSSLLERVKQLEDENTSLLAKHTSLNESIAVLEQVISGNNEQALKAEMSKLELEQIFSSCVDPMCVIRNDGIIARANNKMLQLLKKPVEKVEGKPCDLLFNPELCDREHCKFLVEAGKNEVHQVDITWPDAKDKCRNFIKTISSLVTLDGNPGILVQYKEITERKQAEEALAEAHQELEKLARTDGLTGIPNRRTFDENVRAEWLRLTRDKKPLSLILCDIDFFKKYNDTYGHQQGDECLRQVAKKVENSLMRSTDFAARYGGEEFVVVLPNTPIEGGTAIAERIREDILKLALEHKASDVSPFVTLSLGVATCIPQHEVPVETLIQKADDALYLAKKNGRNCVITP